MPDTGGDGNAEQLERFRQDVEKQTEKVNSLTKLGYQLVNYFLVAQAVVFSALPSYASSLKCHDVWFPLVISLVPGFLILFALFQTRKEFIEAYESLIEASDKFDHAKWGGMLVENPNRDQIKKRFTGYFYAGMIALAFLAIIIAFGCVRMLCWKDHA